MPKAVLVGLDGVSFNIIDPWIEEGFLPTFSRLKQKGTYGVLKSTIPSSTVPGWMAMLTGRGPGRLGYCGLNERVPATYRIGPTDLRWDDIHPVWHLASDQGRRTCVMNVPTAAVPARNMNGIFIAGRGPLATATDRQLALPDRIQEKLREISYRDSVSIPSGLPTPELVRRLTGIADQQCNLASGLFTEEECDLYVFGLFVTDLANHLCLGAEIPDYRYPEDARQDLLRLYQVIDRWLQTLLEKMPEGGNLLISSDHGQTTNRWIVDLNQWLLEKGLLGTRQARRAPLTRQRLFRLLRDVGLLPVYRRLTSRAVLRKADQGIRKRVPLEDTGMYETDWTATQAYSIDKQGIFVNLKGREPQGVVSAGTYEDIRQHVIDSLSALRDPETGGRVVQAIWRREEVYVGPHLEKMPDVAIEWCDGYENRITEGQPTGDLFKRPDRRYSGGGHTRDGVFMAYGPDIEPNKDIDVAQIVDIAPTLLHLAGLPVPEDIDGQVLTAALKPIPRLQDVRQIRPSRHDERTPRTYSRADEEAIKGRLRELGYMD